MEIEETKAKTFDDSLVSITSIRAKLHKRLFANERRMKKEILNLPLFLSHILNNSIDKCKIAKFENIDNEIFKLEFVSDCLNDEFNTGYWKNVDISKRKAFTITSCLKILINLHNQRQIMDSVYLKDIMKCIDIGLLLGAPILDTSENSILSTVGTELMQFFNRFIYRPTQTSAIVSLNPFTPNNPSTSSNLPSASILIDTVENPSLETFYIKYFSQQTPIKLSGCMDHWPAKKKWTSWDYFIKIAGERTVPVEIGSRYTDQDWTQQLMTIREFIDNYIEKEIENQNERGYLAQHTLFDQIPELREDIVTPDYCALSDDPELPIDLEINAWFGPKNTISPLHYDPKNNILCQVIGSKEIILYSPADSEYLYPHDDRLLSNTAKVDPKSPDLEEYPNFLKAKMLKCFLYPGEMLYIPPKWWHHIISLEKSFSVSFWWQ